MSFHLAGVSPFHVIFDFLFHLLIFVPLQFPGWCCNSRCKTISQASFLHHVEKLHTLPVAVAGPRFDCWAEVRFAAKQNLFGIQARNQWEGPWWIHHCQYY